MTWLWNMLLSLLPVADWRTVLEKHGLAAAFLGGCLCLFAASLHFVGYELLVPLRDEILTTSAALRGDIHDLTQAKLTDSITLSRLTSLLEGDKRRKASDDFTHSDDGTSYRHHSEATPR